MVTLQSGTFSRDPATGAVVFKPNTMVSKAAVSPQVVARQQTQESPIYSEATAKKPFTSAQLIPKTTTTETLRPSDIDLAIMGSPIGATPLASGLIQISDFYLGGKSIQKTTEKVGAPVSERIVGTPVVTTREITGGTEVTTTTPVTTTTKTPTERTVVSTPIESGFESVQKSISERAYEIVGKPFGLSGEQTRAGIEASTIVPRAIANKAPTPLNIQMAAGTGEIKSTLDKPVEAAVWAGVGVGTGAATRGAGAAYKYAVETPIAEAAARQGGKWVTALKVSNILTEKAIPSALGTMYATDVVYRSTEGFKEFGAGSIAQKAVPIITLEAAPMGVGAGIGYKSPEIAKSISSEVSRVAPQVKTATTEFVTERVIGPSKVLAKRAGEFDALKYADTLRSSIVGDLPQYRQYKPPAQAAEVMGRSIEFPIGSETKTGGIYDIGTRGVIEEYGVSARLPKLEIIEPVRRESLVSKIFQRPTAIVTRTTGTYLPPESSALGRYTEPGSTFAGTGTGALGFRAKIMERAAGWRESLRAVPSKTTPLLSPKNIELRLSETQFGGRGATTAIGMPKDITRESVGYFGGKGIVGGIRGKLLGKWDIEPVTAAVKATFKKMPSGAYKATYPKEISEKGASGYIPSSGWGAGYEGRQAYGSGQKGTFRFPGGTQESVRDTSLSDLFAPLRKITRRSKISETGEYVYESRAGRGIIKRPEPGISIKPTTELTYRGIAPVIPLSAISAIPVISSMSKTKSGILSETITSSRTQTEVRQTTITIPKSIQIELQREAQITSESQRQREIVETRTFEDVVPKTDQRIEQIPVIDTRIFRTQRQDTRFITDTTKRETQRDRLWSYTSYAGRSFFEYPSLPSGGGGEGGRRRGRYAFREFVDVRSLLGIGEAARVAKPKKQQKPSRITRPRRVSVKSIW